MKIHLYEQKFTQFEPYPGKGGLCASSPKSQHIFKTARTLALLLCDFSFYVFSIKKRSVPPTSSHVCCHGNQATFYFLKTQIANVHEVFPPGRDFLLDSLLCVGHPNTLRSLITANIRTVTMETFQEMILSKYGH